jgi:hypothetical protein
MLKKKISPIALLITGLLTLLMVYLWSSIKGVAGSDGFTSNIDLPESDTAFGGIFYQPFIDDSLPHSKYKSIEDSFTWIKRAKQLRNNGSGAKVMSNSIFGVFAIMNQPFSEAPHSIFRTSDEDPVIKTFIDSINKLYPNPSEKEVIDNNLEIEKKFRDRFKGKADSVTKEKEKDRSYYFTLEGYSLKNYDTKFFIKGNSFNLAYVKWDTIIRRKYDSTQSGHYESKQIKVRYATDAKRILIPVSKKTHAILDVSFIAFTFISIVVILYFFLGLPIQVLVNISKGRAFTEKNIYMLRQISWAAFIIAVLTTASPYIFRLLFWKMIPGDFVLEPFLNTLFENLPILLMALVTFLIAKAFRRGYKLQQYEDMTI